MARLGYWTQGDSNPRRKPDPEWGGRRLPDVRSHREDTPTTSRAVTNQDASISLPVDGRVEMSGLIIRPGSGSDKATCG
ncbi:hypothetical protein RRG08_049280 [Elysia crispata]|uniref:Uncharacterized protein n=1 Tax=Elysia crispata TaxID=231223 RepID=A0AAE0ZNS3_9GAST|nr:hypothetical protein RRG08_049280 [Elysia crispata]